MCMGSSLVAGDPRTGPRTLSPPSRPPLGPCGSCGAPLLGAYVCTLASSRRALLGGCLGYSHKRFTTGLPHDQQNTLYPLVPNDEILFRPCIATPRRLFRQNDKTIGLPLLCNSLKMCCAPHQNELVSESSPHQEWSTDRIVDNTYALKIPTNGCTSWGINNTHQHLLIDHVASHI